MTTTKTTDLLAALDGTSENTIKQDAFDALTYQDISNQSGKLQDTEKQGTESLKTFPNLQQDIFNSFFKYHPEKVPEHEIKKSHRLNQSLIDRAMSSEEYPKLRSHTKMDTMNSALATVTVANKLAESLANELKEEADNANKMCQLGGDMANQQARIDALMNMCKQASGNKKKELSRKLQDEQQHMKDLANQMQKAQENGGKLSQQNAGTVKKAMRKAMSAAEQELDEQSEMLGSWGTEPGALSKMPSEDQIEIAKRIRESTRLKNIAKTLGRFKRLATHAQKTKTQYGRDEVYDIERGNDLSKIIPSELGKLSNSFTKLEFKRNFTEGTLMQYALHGTESKSQGPIIVCMDSSGSISLEQDVWQKALALAMLDIAHKQKRNFYGMLFGADDDELYEQAILKDDAQADVIKKSLDLAEHYINGGTSFEKPLTRAVEVISTQEFEKADVLFITDGECAVSDSFLEKFLHVKASKSFKLHSVLLDVGSATDFSLNQFSDEVHDISKIGNEAAHTIFGSV